MAHATIRTAGALLALPLTGNAPAAFAQVVLSANGQIERLHGERGLPGGIASVSLIPLVACIS